jgi:hypothetical protein
MPKPAGRVIYSRGGYDGRGGDFMMLLLDRFLFKVAGNWNTNLSPDVNSPPSLQFLATQQNSGSMLVHNHLSLPWAGGLVSYHRPLPKLNGTLLPYQAWHIRFRFNPDTYDNLARHEMDNKTCFKTRPNPQTKIRNVANWSTQWNRDTGQIQIDQDPAAWKDTGWIPADSVTTPGDWHTFDWRMHFDPVGLTFTIDSMKWDDDLWINTQPAFQNIPAQESNWEEVVSYQLQNEGYLQGTVMVEYDEGVGAHSDEPISMDVFPTKESYS